MGIFLDQVELVNRTPIDIKVTFDGQAKTLKPGRNTVPAIVVGYAKNQNPIMGSIDPYNPSITGGQYLVGVVGSRDPIDPLTEDEWQAHLESPCREDHRIQFQDKYGSDPKARQIILNKGKKTTATSRYDAGSSPQGLSEFSGKN